MPKFLYASMNVLWVQAVIFQTSFQCQVCTSMISNARQCTPEEKHTGSTPYLEVGDNVAKFFSNIANALKNGVQALRLFTSN
jgi:hypothetical protein